jgi:hypothetical protein
VAEKGEQQTAGGGKMQQCQHKQCVASHGVEHGMHKQEQMLSLSAFL